MKFPSIFRTASHARFDIKPRYYDPVKEEIEQRTAKIKRELQADGKLPLENENQETLNRDYGSSIRGAFTQGSPIKGRSSSMINSAGMIRLIIFLVLLGAFFGYVYLGPDALYTILYIFVGAGLVYLFFRLKGKIRQ
ncbi:hypothetical protein [Aquiflexum sp.]|uniref:hypothetical protein n=1 Tax=Aquiflexum sp. TaxID=1872584 RepID=UPI0035931857